ncbi:NepR family anti-sigma factor [Qipengyuania mesophila]|uniref:NepR family anti-sigma factor n=1 Tax=Qipengyuania mesophila TaxID=2867246 RepID=UPI0035113F7F
MKSDTPKKPQRSTAGGPPPASATQGKGGEPEWANGLRQLYDSVVDEPLPDTFRSLLAQLDSKD